MSADDIAEDQLIRDVLGVTLQSTENNAQHHLPSLATVGRSFHPNSDDALRGR